MLAVVLVLWVSAANAYESVDHTSDAEVGRTAREKDTASNKLAQFIATLTPEKMEQMFNKDNNNPDPCTGETHITAPINERGLCPWVWQTNYDSTREPDALQVARCLCVGRSRLAAYECHPLMFYVSVKRNGTELAEKIPLACTAVHVASLVSNAAVLQDTVEPID